MKGFTAGLKIDTVIFDMDGLMFDTERTYNDAFRHAGDVLGIPDAGELSKLTMGADEETTVSMITGRCGGRARAKAVFALVKDYIADQFLHHPTPVKPGLYALLEYLKQNGYKVGIASGSPAYDISHHLEGTNTARYFDAIVSSDMVPVAKPAPDLYIKCRELLHADADRCVALEDSPNGVHSAVDAGIRVIMVPDLVQPDETLRSLLFAVLPDLAAVIPLLETLR